MSYIYRTLFQLFILIVPQGNDAEKTALENRDVELQWDISPQDAAQPVQIVHPSGANLFIALGDKAYDSGGGFNGRYNFTGDTTTGNIHFILKTVTRADAGTFSSIAGNVILGGVTLVVYSSKTIVLQNRDVELQWDISPQAAAQPVRIVHPSGMNMFIVLGDKAYDSDGGFNRRYNFTGDATTGDIDFTLKAVTRADAGAYFSVSGNVRLGGAILEVYYGPGPVNLSPTSTSYTLLETRGTLGPIACSAECKPACTYQWKRDGTDVTTGAVIRVNNITRGQAGTYTCTATNKHNPQERVSSAVSVFVQYGPGPVKMSPNNASYTLLEARGTLGPITCSADCKPACTYQWKRDGTDVTTGAVVRVNNITRGQAGTYTCTATKKHNQKGRVSNAVNVVVEYSPEVTISYNNNSYNQKSSKMICTAEGNPSINTFYAWEHKSEDGQHVRFILGASSSNTSTLTIPDLVDDLKFQNSGYYICTASNGVPDTSGLMNVSKQVYYYVAAPPALKMISPKMTGELYSNISVTVSFYSNPVYTSVKWSKNKENNLIDLSEDRFVQTVTDAVISLPFNGRYITFNGKNATLKIQNIKEVEFTNYTLRVKNFIGETNYTVEIQSVGPPNPPIGIAAVCTCGNTAEIIWISKFNGGNDQHFHIGLKTAKQEKYALEKELMDAGEDETMREIVDGLEDETRYFFTVYTENKYGRSMLAKDLQCVTPVKGAPNIASVVLFVLSAVLVVCVVAGISIRSFLKRHRNTADERSNNDVSKEQTEMDLINAYQELGDRQVPVDAPYQELQESRTDSVPSQQVNIHQGFKKQKERGANDSYQQIEVANIGTKLDAKNRNVYDDLGQQNLRNVYDELKFQENK